MNIENAKTVALSDILSKIGFEPSKQNDTEAWYYSPFRKEKTPSFKVNLKKNIWHDFGEGVGGDIINFACVYLEKSNENCTVSDALRFIENISGNAPRIAPVKTGDDGPCDEKLSIISVKKIAHPALIAYLDKRGIQVEFAKPVLDEVRVKNNKTRNSMFALGIKNVDGGYDLRNPFFKGCVGPKTISFLRGTIAKPNGLHIFEGFMDYLSIITDIKKDKLEDDTIILNSLSCIEHATPYIKGYGYKTVWTYLDNDKAGEKALKSLDEFFKTEEGLVHRPMNESYREDKDVNAWHMRNLGLTLEA
ncbi:toprim domain-containing protein [Chryseolinea sp. H1M3-3]|uniref:toprim domain-containing protein n=1 Tax=Chryseolinea sp. H1M3-3 TaxID=3034144 RepID=UPI0023EB4945|nr:toprim domain-containing protein [Chryseolinea sp. H1M3-3]